MKVEDYLKEKGFEDRGTFLIRYSSPRLGYCPKTGELIIGFHSKGRGHNTIESINEELSKNGINL